MQKCKDSPRAEEAKSFPCNFEDDWRTSVFGICEQPALPQVIFQPQQQREFIVEKQNENYPWDRASSLSQLFNVRC